MVNENRFCAITHQTDGIPICDLRSRRQIIRREQIVHTYLIHIGHMTVELMHV